MHARIWLLGVICAFSVFVSVDLLHGAVANDRSTPGLAIAQADDAILEASITSDPQATETPAKVETATAPVVPTDPSLLPPTPELPPTATPTLVAGPTVPSAPELTSPLPTADAAESSTPDSPPSTATRLPDPTATSMPTSQPPAPSVTLTNAAVVVPAPPLPPPTEMPRPTSADAAIATLTRSVAPTLVRTNLASQTPMRLPGATTQGELFAEEDSVVTTPWPSVIRDATYPPRISPLGATYTIWRARTTDGHHLVTVCIANTGSDSVREVSVTFALSQPDAAIISLHAPLSPSEIGSKQARAIIGTMQPGQQVQVSVVLWSEGPLYNG